MRLSHLLGGALLASSLVLSACSSTASDASNSSTADISTGAGSAESTGVRDSATSDTSGAEAPSTDADGGSGASDGAKDPFHYAGEDRTEYLTECANKEGALEIYTTQNPTLADALKDAFSEKYPDIKVNSTRRTTPATAEAVTKEAGAGVNKVDVIHLKIEVVDNLLDLLTNFDSPELAAYPEKAVGPDGKYVVSGQVPYGIIYNTDHVDDADAPKTSQDLLDPKWKGKIAFSTTGPGTQWIGYMYKKYGLDYIKALGKQGLLTSAVNTNAITAQVASGDAWIAPAINLSGFSGLKGAPLKWNPIDATSAQDTVEIAKAAPHPCAAMLYTDFALSKEAQTINPDYISARTDVESTGQLVGLDPVGIWEIVGKHDAQAYQSSLKEWTQLIDQYIIGG